MKYYVIVDKAAKYCPYISTMVVPVSNTLIPFAVDDLSKARHWMVSDTLGSTKNESDIMLNLFKENKLQGKDWEIRELTFVLGPPLKLPW